MTQESYIRKFTQIFPKRDFINNNLKTFHFFKSLLVDDVLFYIIDNKEYIVKKIRIFRPKSDGKPKHYKKFSSRKFCLLYTRRFCSNFIRRELTENSTDLLRRISEYLYIYMPPNFKFHFCVSTECRLS